MLVSLPAKFLAHAIQSELNCMSYDPTNEVLVFIKDFAIADENGELQAQIDMYPMPKEHPLSAMFEVALAGAPIDMTRWKMIDTSPLDKNPQDQDIVKAFAQIFNQLYEFMDKTTCVHSTSDNLMSAMPHQCDDDCQDHSHDIMMDIDPTEIPTFEDTPHEAE